MTTLLISKKTAKNQDLCIYLDRAKIVITIDGKTIPNKNSLIESHDFKGVSGLGKMVIVAGIAAVTPEEGTLLKRAITEAKDKQWEIQKSAKKQEYIRLETVKLKQHCYSDKTQWYLCYGDLMEQIFPSEDIDLNRSFDEEYLDGFIWYLDCSEYTKLSTIPTTKTEPTYDLTEEKGIPEGTKEIENAQRELSTAHAEYERAQRLEEIHASYPDAKKLQTLLNRYPRAALYLKCKEFGLASNHNKAIAGEKAETLLLQGGKSFDVTEILDNWLPASAWYD